MDNGDIFCRNYMWVYILKKKKNDHLKKKIY